MRCHKPWIEMVSTILSNDALNCRISVPPFHLFLSDSISLFCHRELCVAIHHGRSGSKGQVAEPLVAVVNALSFKEVYEFFVCLKI